MKRLLALALAVALVGFGVPVPAAAAERAGQISGFAKSGATGLANSIVQVRNTTTGQLAGKTTANAQGAFSFTGLRQGSYIVEGLDTTGRVIGTSSAVSLTATAMVATGVVVNAAAPAAQAEAAAGPGFWAAYGPAVLLAAAGVGIAIAANKGSKSGSK